MWICVSCIERNMLIISKSDKKETVQADMYNDMCEALDGESNLLTLIDDGEAEIVDDGEYFGWANYRGLNYDWKCFEI